MSYKLYQSKKYIWWDTIDKVDVPYNFENIDFNWELVDSNNIYFESWKHGKIVVKDNDVTYFKLEHENKRTTYWFADQVNKVLSSGYEIKVVLDFWATFGKDALNAIVNSQINPLIERMHISKSMWNDNTLNESIRNILYNDDEFIDNIEINDFDYEIITSANSGPNTIDINYGGVSGLLQYINPSNLKTWSDGVYAVFINKKTSRYDFFPIVAERNPSGLYIVERANPNNRMTQLSNTYSEIMEYLVNVDTSNYTTQGFVGIYRGPLFDVITPQGVWQHTSSTINGVKKDFFYTSWEIDYYVRDLNRFPVAIDWNSSTNFIESAINLQNLILWGSTPFKTKKLIWTIDYHDRTFYTLNFIDGFYLSPVWKNSKIDDAVYFGSALPSATQDYANKIKIAKQNYDSGLSSSITSTIGGSIGTIATAAVNPVLGAVSGATLGVNLVSSLLINGQNYKKAISGAHPTFINSNTKDIYYHWLIKSIRQESGLFSKDGLFYQNYVWLKPKGLIKEQMKQIYDQYGFNFKIPFNLKYIFDNLNNFFTRRLYLKINEGWLASYLKITFKNRLSSENTEVLKEIASLFSNGLRLWLIDEPNYSEVND